MQVTAKVKCTARESAGDGQDRVTFGADYVTEDGKEINAEWAKYTPGLQLTMTVLESVPFEQGKSFTLTFDDGE